MNDSQPSAFQPSRPAAPLSSAGDEFRVHPSSSRMLTNYLADVEQNLDEHRWDLALQDVVDLPSIAVALANPELRSSREQCAAWCEQWVRPTEGANESGLSHEHICRVLDEQSGAKDAGGTVPSRALRRLRLRRHARHAPRGFNASHTAKQIGEEADTFAICTAVVEAVRRWYAHSACHDAIAQANLARLAVLR